MHPSTMLTREETMQVARVNSVRLHYAETGDPAGRPVVFANSLGTDIRVWDRLLPLLPRGVRLVRYDMRGHGLSDAPEGDYGMDDLVADVADLIEHLALRDVVVVGLSIGGLIAQGLAARRPDLVRALVLSNTAAKIGTVEIWDERIAAVRGGGIAAIADGILERWFSPAFRAGRPDELALWRHMLTRTPAAGYLGCCAALAAADLRESSAALRLPTIAIAGSIDGSTPPDVVRGTADLIPGSRFEVIEGAGHIPCVEKPEAHARLIAGFLGEIGVA
jgi:3-oxoadipate enol-lactonase